MPSLQDTVNQFRAALLAREQRAERRMAEQYAVAWRATERELRQLLDRAEKRRDASEEVSRGWLYRAGRLGELLAQLDARLTDFGSTAVAAVTEEQRVSVRRALDDARRLTAEALGPAPSEARTAVVARFARVPEEALTELVGAMTDGSPLRETFAKLPAAVAEGLERELVTGLTIGRNPVIIARRAQDAVGEGLSRSVRIARTEVLRAYRESSRRSYQENSEVVEGWVWVSALGPRTCFPAGTPVCTARGMAPIERVRVGDQVLTHAGRYRRVYETLRRHYAGTMVTVSAAGLSVCATADHPFLVERKGKLDWIEADQIRLGDSVFLDCQRGSHIVDHGVCERAIERRGDQAEHSVSAHLQGQGLLRVSRGGFGVPVGLVNLQRGAALMDEEIDGRPPATDLRLLGERDPEALQTASDVGFGLGLPLKSAVATHGTEAPTIGRVPVCARIPRLGFRWENPETLAARQALLEKGRPATVFGAVPPIAAGPDKDAPASFARAIVSHLLLAAVGAVDLPRSRGIYPKHLPTLRALLVGARCRAAAGYRAVVRHLAMVLHSEPIAAVQADGLAPRSSGGASRSPSVGVLDLVSRVAGLGAEASSASSGPSGRDGEGSVTFQASAFHPAIVSNIRYQFNETDVFNLEVEQDHSYVAAGFVVHNCAACWSMHGSFHANDERLDGHPACRCTMVPRTRSWDELGFPGLTDTRPVIEPGPELFERQPESVKRAVLGNAGYEALLRREVTLVDFLARRDDERWGTVRYSRSLRAIRQGRGGEQLGAAALAPSAVAAPVRALSPQAQRRRHL